MKIILIRHGKTQSNLNRTYTGIKDEPILADVCDDIAKNCYPTVEAVFTSPLQRAKQTAALIYKTSSATINDGLIERDFGDYEGKNYDELKSDPIYRAWIDSKGLDPCPNGEDGIIFRERCAKAFKDVVSESAAKGYSTIAIVCHGGTIMAIMDSITDYKEGFFHWQSPNLGGYIIDYDQVSKKAVIENLLK